MAERLESLVNAHTLLLRDVSHELRSPLTRVNVAVGLTRKSTSQEGLRHLDRIENEVDRLNILIAQLLTLGAMETAATDNFEQFRLDEMILEIVPDARYEAIQRGCSISVDLSGSPDVMGNRELLQRAVWNVLRNAVQYSPPNTTVIVTVRSIMRKSSFLVIEIADQGPGIASEDLEAIFRPFFRSDQARSSASGGFGVGLAITERAVKMHQGKIAARNRSEGGTLIQITLPTGL